MMLAGSIRLLFFTGGCGRASLVVAAAGMALAVAGGP